MGWAGTLVLLATTLAAAVAAASLGYTLDETSGKSKWGARTHNAGHLCALRAPVSIIELFFWLLAGVFSITVDGAPYLLGLPPSFTSEGVLLSPGSGLVLTGAAKTMGADGFGP